MEDSIKDSRRKLEEEIATTPAADWLQAARMEGWAELNDAMDGPISVKKKNGG